jgi:hypothetical protein
MPWRRRKPDEEPSQSRADRAIEISESRLDEARERRREFRRFATRMKQIRERNHLAEAFERAFGEGGH